MKHLTQPKNRFQNKMRYFLLMGIIFISTSLQAQNREIDSLENMLNKKTLSDHERYQTYQELIQAYIHTDREKSLDYVRKGLRLAEKTKTYYYFAQLYHSAGTIHFYLNQLDSAAYYFEKGLAMHKQAVIKKELNEDELNYIQMRLFLGIATLDYASGRYDLVLESYYKALAILEKMNKTDEAAFICLTIANLYKFMLNDNQAEIYYLKTEKMYRELNDLSGIAYAYLGLGTVYRHKMDFPKALEYAEDAYRMLTTLPNPHPAYLMESTRNLADIWSVIPDYDKALKFALKAVEYARQANRKDAMAATLATLAQCYLQQKRYKEADETAFQALATDSTKKQINSNLYQIIAEANIGLKNSAKAIEYFNKTIKAKDNYSNQNFQSSISEMEVKYETEKKEHEIERQQNIIARHSMYRWILTGCVVICVLIIALFVVLLRLRKRHNKILAEMNATKDKFFSIISHDLKNPAIAQRDAIQQLIENADKWNNNELADCCNDLLKSANEEVELLYTLLGWAQIQTGRIAYTPVTFDIAIHLHTDISLIRKMAEFKNITLTNHIPNHALVTGDINMLTTVVRNLLTNAVKFTPVGGAIVLAIEQAPNEKHIISVSDTGNGMTQEEIRNIFNIDNRQSRQGTIGEQGSGLGLIVCIEMLEKHKCVLHVESEEGKGSKFWFEI
ncbi:MAG: ATP-binding protein [Bacteroidetes bacterium]|nr:ATP-binding protein [Bacteroidota bacterium]MCL1968424.1 ATP-binding protein [Bacteroidota bacterium]